jgi:hypothetical protein
MTFSCPVPADPASGAEEMAVSNVCWPATPKDVFSVEVPARSRFIGRL